MPNDPMPKDKVMDVLFDGLFQQRLASYFSNYPQLSEEKLKSVFQRAISLAMETPETATYFATSFENNISDYVTVLDYCTGEYRYQPELEVEELAKTALFRFSLLRDADKSDDVLTENTNYFDPVISTMRCMDNFLFRINKPLAKKRPNLTLVMDISETIFKKIAGFCKMMNFGLYTDAFVSWRTLHESECILSLLVNGGENIRQSYVEHIAYNNQLRNQENYTQEELDLRFAKMKDVMRMHGLKSKDMKKFIEYGWIYDHPDFHSDDKKLKLNFRDGVERLAKLRRYASIYEASSEITHSSSTFFYADDEECRQLALGLTYESFKRITMLYHQFMITYFMIHKSAQATFERLYEDLDKMQKNITAICKQQIINYPGDSEPPEEETENSNV